MYTTCGCISNFYFCRLNNNIDILRGEVKPWVILPLPTHQKMKEIKETQPLRDGDNLVYVFDKKTFESSIKDKVGLMLVREEIVRHMATILPIFKPHLVDKDSYDIVIRVPDIGYRISGWYFTDDAEIQKLQQEEDLYFMTIEKA
ncbi:MAG: hypothetical protein KatS3mg101_1070 [Patescibacteria group bacterium]|nr:MAG: hypothetical protein KatS3mg101_1070 [Patescibacteria group bacterium]